MPLPALITSHIRLGSRPALPPIAIPSELAAMPVAERKLLASFMLWARPGRSPQTNTLPNTSSAGRTCSISSFGPDTSGGRAAVLVLFCGAPHHPRQRALLGAGDAAAHRAVDLHDVALL